MKNLIATIKSWNIENAGALQQTDHENEWHLITNPEEFTPEAVRQIDPRYIFVPHWSWIIPQSIWGGFETVVFHGTDLPFGRGGSPIQNLIASGIYDTQISALKVDNGLDTGPIYMKSPMDISHGTVEDILRKASQIIFERMIPFICSKQPIPQPQAGEAVLFKRRTPEQGDLTRLNSPSPRRLYDHIRMLDGEGYPKAYIPINGGKLEFYGAHLDGDKFDAKVKFVENKGHG